MKKLIDKLIAEKKRFLFISPHLDDAILSCGGLITYLRKKAEVEVITVFTEVSDGTETRFARLFIKNCGYLSSIKLFKERRIEDGLLFNKLKIKYKHLGFIDAAWRKKKAKGMLALLGRYLPELIHLYPRQKDVFLGRTSQFDAELIVEIEEELIKFKKKQSALVIFCPIGIGSHVDHIMVREICRKIFKSVIYWADFHYSLFSKPEPEFIKNNGLVALRWEKNLKIKEELIKSYKTQLFSIFPTGKIPAKDEAFYFSSSSFKIS